MANPRPPVRPALERMLQGQYAPTTLAPGAQPATGGKKGRGTYDLRPATLERLDQAWLRLRDLARQGQLPAQHSKNCIVDAALELVLAELDAAGLESPLVRALLAHFPLPP